MRRLPLALLVVALTHVAAPAAIGQVPAGAQVQVSDMGGANGEPALGAGPPAIAYNSTAGDYLAVWSGDDDGAPTVDDEFEIWGRRLDGHGQPAGPRFRISVMGDDSETDPAQRRKFEAINPSLVYSDAQNQYLVVWEADDDSGPLVEGEHEIWARRVDATGTPLGAQFRVSDMGDEGETNAATRAGFDARRPSVAASSSEYMVVWEGDDDVDDEFEIYAQRLFAQTTSPIGANDLRISQPPSPAMDVPNGDALAPAVARDPALTGRWLVVWRSDENTLPHDAGGAPEEEGDFEIFGQLINTSGTQVAPLDFQISNHLDSLIDPDLDAYEPAVAFNSRQSRWFVTWHGDDQIAQLVDGEHEIHGEFLSATGVQVPGGEARFSTAGPDGDPSFDAENSTLAYNPTSDEFVLAWEADDNKSGQVDGSFEIWGRRVSGDGSSRSEIVLISKMGSSDADPAYDGLAPAAAFGTTPNEYLVTWHGDDDTGSLVDGELEVFARRYQAPAIPDPDPAIVQPTAAIPPFLPQPPPTEPGPAAREPLRLLSFRARASLRTLLKRRVVRVRARCSRSCTLAVRGSIKIAKRRQPIRVRRVRRRLVGVLPRTIAVRVSKRTAKVLKQARRKRRKVVFRLTGRARDVFGNSVTRRRNARLRR